MSGWDYLSSVRGVPAVFWFAVSAMVGIMVSMALTLAVRLLFGCLRSVHGAMEEFFFFLNATKRGENFRARRKMRSVTAFRLASIRSKASGDKVARA
jgi:hypothetical protein